MGIAASIQKRERRVVFVSGPGRNVGSPCVSSGSDPAGEMPFRHMAPHCRTLAILVFLVFPGATASAQFPPLSMYGLLDRGAVPLKEACPCIQDPFRVPQFVPAGYGSGPAAPLETDRLPPGPRKNLAREYAADRANLHASATAALAGSGGDSFGVAMHMALGELLVNAPDPSVAEQTSRWYHLAAQQDHHDAFVRLAYRYLHGRGVPKDDGAAAYWTHQGAVRGERLAMVAMGLTYATGRGVPQDWPTAVEWWRRTAPESAVATLFIGDAYVCGLGVQPSLDRAVEAYRDARTRGEISASIRLGDLYTGGCLAGPQDAAMKAYSHAAEHGYPDAQLALSELLREGRGTAPDAYRAYWFARMAERRLPEGELKTLAAQRAREAAVFLSELWIADAEKMVDSMLKASGVTAR